MTDKTPRIKIVNLTPHKVTCVGEDLEEIATFPPSGEVARVAVSGACVGSALGVPILRQEYGEVTGLPGAKPGVYCLVSGVVRAASKDRSDLLSPAELIRDPRGRVIGCRAFATA